MARNFLVRPLVHYNSFVLPMMKSKVLVLVILGVILGQLSTDGGKGSNADEVPARNEHTETIDEHIDTYLEIDRKKGSKKSKKSKPKKTKPKPEKPSQKPTKPKPKPKPTKPSTTLKPTVPDPGTNETLEERVNLLEAKVNQLEASLATKCDATTCSNIHAIETCLGDVSSLDCPSSPPGMTGLAAALADKCDASTCEALETADPNHVLWTGLWPSQTVELPDFTPVQSGCEVAKPDVNTRESVFQEIQGKMYTCSHTGCKQYVQEENKWETIQGTKFVSERREAAGTVVGNGGKWLVQGGNVYVNGKTTDVATAEVWTPGTGSWVEDPQYTSPLPVSEHCLLNVKGSVMQIGGRSIASGGWTSRCFLDGQEVARLKARRQNHACAVFQDQVWVAGGAMAREDKGAVEIYDPAKNTWTDGPKRPMTTSDQHPKLLVYLGQLYYIGGNNIGKIYKLEQSKWNEVRDIQKGYKQVSLIINKTC